MDGIERQIIVSPNLKTVVNLYNFAFCLSVCDKINCHKMQLCQPQGFCLDALGLTFPRLTLCPEVYSGFCCISSRWNFPCPSRLTFLSTVISFLSRNMWNHPWAGRANAARTRATTRSAMTRARTAPPPGLPRTRSLRSSRSMSHSPHHSPTR